MTGIPHNLEPDSPINTKITELIKSMYYVVTILKARGDDKLARTVKGLMVVCYGDSIKKPKSFKNKFTSNVETKVEEQYQYVAKWSNVNNGKTGFVTTINNFRPHFNHVQFGKLILDNYHKKVQELEQLVNILYYNIDAFLIDESDYNKLLELGYIGDEMGQLKVETIFTEVCFKSQRKWMGRCVDGSIYCRPTKLIEKTSFEEFKNNI
jgi:hypothetical protein